MKPILILETLTIYVNDPYDTSSRCTSAVCTVITHIHLNASNETCHSWCKLLQRGQDWSVECCLSAAGQHIQEGGRMLSDCDSSQAIRAAAQVWAVWMGSMEVHVEWDTSFPIVQSAMGSAVTWCDSFASCFTQIAALAHCSLWGRKGNTSTSSKPKALFWMLSRNGFMTKLLFSKTEVVINLNV